METVEMRETKGTTMSLHVTIMSLVMPAVYTGADVFSCIIQASVVWWRQQPRHKKALPRQNAT